MPAVSATQVTTQARLIPTLATHGNRRELHAVSAFLAVLRIVRPLAKELLGPLEAPASPVETYTEERIGGETNQRRADGLIAIPSRAHPRWGALIEAKTGESRLEPSQLQRTYDAVTKRGYNYLISISNQFVVPRVGGRHEHWPWAEVLAVARGIRDRQLTQTSAEAFLLDQLIAYLEDERAGTVPDPSMGKSWKALIAAARAGRLRTRTPGADTAVDGWFEAMHMARIALTESLNRRFSAPEADPVNKAQARSDLMQTGTLSGSLVSRGWPTTAVSAVLAGEVLKASARIQTRPRGRSDGDITRLLDGLNDAPRALQIEMRPRGARTDGERIRSATLSQLRADPTRLLPDRGRIATFNLSLERRFAAPSHFAKQVAALAAEFGETVLTPMPR